MTQAPSKLYWNIDIYGEGYASASENRNMDIEKTFTYTLEEPVTQEEPKTMTAKDAWYALIDGEFVKCGGRVHKIEANSLLWWSGLDRWLATCELDEGPYSIVPDPSKPIVENEYNDNRIALLNLCKGEEPIEDVFKDLLIYIDRWYVRKEK